MRAQNFFGQLVQVLCVMQQEVVLQFVRLQPALTHKSLVTMLTFSQNLPIENYKTCYIVLIPYIPLSPCRGRNREDILHYLGNVFGERKSCSEVGT